MNFHVLKCSCSLLMTEGFFCSLGVCYVGLWISKLQFLIKKIKFKISSCHFFSILGHQTRIRIQNADPKSGSAIGKNASSGSALIQCGSATLVGAKFNHIRHVIA
jgi:hypothetical protein